MVDQIEGLSQVQKDSTNEFTIVHGFQPVVGDIKQSSFT